jgi:hypothetical protein
MTIPEPFQSPFREGQQFKPAAMDSMRRDTAEIRRHIANHSQPPKDPLDNSPALVEHFPGIITFTPPPDATPGDYTDCRYYVKYSVPRQDISSTDSMFEAQEEPIQSLQRTITATNLAEKPLQSDTDHSPGGTHTLRAKTVVHVFGFLTRNTADGPGVKTHCFFHSGEGLFRVKVYPFGTTTHAGATVPSYRIKTTSGKDIPDGANLTTTNRPAKQIWRMAGATYTTAPSGSDGFAYYDDNGDLQLATVDGEILDTAGCVLTGSGS